MKIAVLIACLNEEQALQKTLKLWTAIKRTSPIKIFFADGGSCDRTAEFITAIADGGVISKDQGVYDALNKMLKSFSFDYYICFGASDEPVDDIYSKIESALERNSYPDILVFPVNQGSSVKHPVSHDRLFPPTSHHSVGTLISRRAHYYCGSYNKQLRVYGDLDFLSRCSRCEGLDYRCENVVLGTYAGGGLSSTITAPEIKERALVEARAGHCRSYWKAGQIFRLLRLHLTKASGLLKLYKA